jgi:nicotinamidase-related amidase
MEDMNMADKLYRKDDTAFLFVDPYNDFLSDGGKLWPMVKGVADEVNLLDNLRALNVAVRKVGIQVFFVPHHRSNDFAYWDHANPYQLQWAKSQAFAKDSWGGEWPTSNLSRATSSPRSTGAQAVSPIPISICC